MLARAGAADRPRIPVHHTGSEQLQEVLQQGSEDGWDWESLSDMAFNHLQEREADVIKWQEHEFVRLTVIL